MRQAPVARGEASPCQGHEATVIVGATVPCNDRQPGAQKSGPPRCDSPNPANLTNEKGAFNSGGYFSSVISSKAARTP
ncbi:hypothetical protein RRG08_030675 [Elysia crispata]|uniref:Uncharacterized protein n=1 Tax=Elysia crispata TaxID=231223 RepID=A0AAE0YJ43_9GAST|nr:hypothetical protein RRG08_030675 [Elysia crispata]